MSLHYRLLVNEMQTLNLHVGARFRMSALRSWNLFEQSIKFGRTAANARRRAFESEEVPSRVPTIAISCVLHLIDSHHLRSQFDKASAG